MSEIENATLAQGSYRLGRAMAEKGWARPAENIITFYRQSGHSLPRFHRGWDAAEERHRLMLRGWDEASKELNA